MIAATRGRPPAAIPKDDQLLIRTTSELADTIRTCALMRGESLHDWLARVSADEIKQADASAFNVHIEPEGT